MADWTGSLRAFGALDDGVCSVVLDDRCRAVGALDDSAGFSRYCERSVTI